MCDCYEELKKDKDYPCTKCENEKDCLIGCKQWKLWFKYRWRGIQLGINASKSNDKKYMGE